MTFSFAEPDGLVEVTVGSLDRPQDFAPTHHVWTSARLPWVADDGLPAHAEVPSGF